MFFFIIIIELGRNNLEITARLQPRNIIKVMFSLIKKKRTPRNSILQSVASRAFLNTVGSLAALPYPIHLLEQPNRTVIEEGNMSASFTLYDKEIRENFSMIYIYRMSLK